MTNTSIHLLKSLGIGFMTACTVLVAMSPARAQQETEPVLHFDTGMHTAAINRIATDAQGRRLATASHDKTLRIWEIASGRLLQVLRPPIGKGNEGT
jgi:WD40 repeat protein